MHYDLEVSGFPSSHAGHLVLLGLKDQDYPGTQRLEDWPTWTLPILRWAKAQGAVVGFAHSGWGLEVRSRDLPNYEMPAFDGIGANEFIVDVTHPGRRRLHLGRRHAAHLGTEHLVSHAERGIPDAHQRRDGLPLHHRRSRRACAFVREGRRGAYVPQVDRRGAGGPQLRLRRQEPPDGFHGERRRGRDTRQRGESRSCRSA